MMKRILFYITMSGTIGSAMAQQAITPDVLKQLSDSYENNGNDKAIRNAVSANSIKKLALNQENTATPDTWFSNKVNSSGITDQEKSLPLLAVYRYQRHSGKSHGTDGNEGLPFLTGVYILL